MTGETAPKSQGIPGWVVALVIACGLCLCGVPAIGGALAVLVPRVRMQQQRAVCADRLRTLGELHIRATLDDPGLPHGGGGVGYFLHLTTGALEGGILLVCPDDRAARPAEVVQLGSGELTEQSEPVLRMVCSYAVRDFVRFPIGEDFGREVIAADREEFHRGGINVLYSDGSVHFMDREALGIAEGDPIVVGPDSGHPELAKLCIVPRR